MLVTLAVPAPTVAACRAIDHGDPPPDAADAAADGGPGRDAAGPEADAAPLDGPAETSDAGDPGACAPVTIDGSAYDEPPDACVVFRQLPCGVPADAQVSDCFPDLALCGASCGGGFLLYCLLAPGTCGDGGIVPDAAVVLECISCTAGGGRRPRGLAAPRLSSRSPSRPPLGDHFAAMAHLESASVRAFRDLTRWLLAAGAPPASPGPRGELPATSAATRAPSPGSRVASVALRRAHGWHGAQRPRSSS